MCVRYAFIKGFSLPRAPIRTRERNAFTAVEHNLETWWVLILLEAKAAFYQHYLSILGYSLRQTYITNFNWLFVVLPFLCPQFLLTTMLILGCRSGASTEPHMQTFQHEDPYSGRLLECQLCPPGTYLRKACSDDNGKSDCAKCPTGSFTELWNYIPKCLRCGMCVGNRVVKKECTPSQNCVCECKPGHYFNKWLQDCTRHTECSSGYGVISKGRYNAESNTILTNCRLVIG